MIIYLPRLQTLPTKVELEVADSLPRLQTLPTKATDSTYQGRTGGDRFSTKAGVDRLSLLRLELTDSLYQGWS